MEWLLILCKFFILNINVSPYPRIKKKMNEDNLKNDFNDYLTESGKFVKSIFN